MPRRHLILMLAVGISASAMAEEAGYGGEPIRFMLTTSYPEMYDTGSVAVQQMEAAGFNVDLNDALESFLRTVCGAHHANHLALKLRQFLLGLVPVLFPARIYGKDWLHRD